VNSSDALLTEPWTTRTVRSPILHHGADGLALVAFGVDLGYVGLGMAEDDAGGFEAELLAEFGGSVVAKLVRVPVVGFPPSGEFGLLFLRQAILPLGVGLVLALGQRLWRQEGTFAGANNGDAITVSRVPLAGHPFRIVFAVRARSVSARWRRDAILVRLSSPLLNGFDRAEAVRPGIA